MTAIRTLVTSFALLATAIAPAMAADEQPKPKPHLGYQDTPLIPGTKWHVHDGERPQPKVVTPGTFSSQEQQGKPPSDAIVLFDGKDLAHFKNEKWKLEDGAMIAGGGEQETKDVFGDIQLHIEWMAPTPPKGDGQGRGNSGVFLMGRYELQVLDCFENQTYPDGQATAIYGQTPPLVNACRKPGEWQTYDAMWTAPRFDGDKLVSPAFITVIHNGVLVQNHTQLIGNTPHKQVGTYSPHGDGPLKMQDHGNPVRYRNIWVRKLLPIDQP